MDIHRVIGKLPFKPKKGFVLPKHRFTGPYNPLHLQLDSKDNPPPGNESYNAVDAISMRHDICYRDYDIQAGKRECDSNVLAELNVLVPEGRREKVDRQLVRSIIGLKHRMGLRIDWSNLHRQEYKVLSKQKISNLFNSQEALGEYITSYSH